VEGVYAIAQMHNQRTENIICWGIHNLIQVEWINQH